MNYNSDLNSNISQVPSREPTEFESMYQYEWPTVNVKEK